MMPMLILLPGLDGTGRLFRPLLDVIPPSIARRVISYPPDQVCSFDALFHASEDQLQGEQEMILVAESFSGPLALRLSVAHPSRIRAVILCASFISSPVSPWFRPFVNPYLFRWPLPACLVRRFLMGRSAPNALVQEVKNTIRSVQPQVLAQRVREVLTLDASAALAQCPVPILYLRAAHDALVGQTSAKAIRAIRQDVKVAAVEGPHLLLQARPAAAWGEIMRFLQEQGMVYDATKDSDPSHYEAFVSWLKTHTAKQLKAATGDRERVRFLIREFLQRGHEARLTSGELTDFFCVDTPSILELAGFHEAESDEAVRVFDEISSEHPGP